MQFHKLFVTAFVEKCSNKRFGLLNAGVSVFNDEKTFVFWVGLIILGLSSVVLFAIIWFYAMAALKIYPYTYGPSFEFYVPFIVAAIVFILIGLYMMKSGVKQA